MNQQTQALLEHCELCPRRCGANRAAGKRGVCGAAGELRIARAALHFWEEPPISGEAGSGTVFFSNCPLHCVYCQNASIANGSCGADITVRRLAQVFLDLQAQGALNINLVTAVQYVPYILQAAPLAREAGLRIPFVYNTSGYETPETIALLGGLVDTYLTDFRYMSPALAADLSRAPDYPEVAKAALAAMAASGADVIVRVLLLPGHVDEAKRIVEYVYGTYEGLYREGRLRLSLMSQYTPAFGFDVRAGGEAASQGARMPEAEGYRVGESPQVKRALREHPELLRTVSVEEFEELLDFTDALGCEDYFWQEGDAAQESFIPDFDALVGVAGPEL